MLPNISSLNKSVIQIVKVLIGWTPLHFASHGGHMNIIEYLITEQGCDPTILNNDGNLPVHIACRNGHLNATKYFITEQKCDPNSRGQYGRTPLHQASQGGHMNIIKYLITEQGCNQQFQQLAIFHCTLVVEWPLECYQIFHH